ncbi:MAG: hypothetical protein WC341_07785 [Bacteroidales bacterium]|jgi:hypothetical protein
MAQDKPCLLNIPKAYRTKALDQWMFGYCQGLQQLFPKLTDQDAIKQFMKWARLNEDDYSMDVAATKYTQMKRDFLVVNNKIQ